MRKTHYPIIFIHGATTGRYFLNPPIKSLVKKINKIGYDNFYYVIHDAFASIEENCNVVIEQIEKIMEQTHAEKVNLIGYSKGGIEARYIASKSKIKDKIASVSLYSTPNKGLFFSDWFLKKKRVCLNLFFKFCEKIYYIFKDEQCSIKNVITELSSENMKTFNENVSDNEKVFYQSFLTVSSSIFDSFFLFIFNIITSKYAKDEIHDGFVHESSAKWGEFHLFTNSKHMTHLHVIGFFYRRKHSILNFEYIINKLIERGF